MIHTNYLRPGNQGSSGAGSNSQRWTAPGNYGGSRPLRRVMPERQSLPHRVSARSTMNDFAPIDRDGTAGAAESTGAPETTPWRRAGELFNRYRRDDRAALDELVLLLTPVLWQVVRAYRLDRPTAEDVVQTTWLTLVRHQATIADPLAVSSWVMVTARREAWRVSRQSSRVEATADEMLAPRIPRAASAESEVMLSDTHRRLWAAVDALSDRCRRLLRVVAFEDRPDYAGLAKDLAMPIGSIGPTRGRCLAKLRETLGPRNDLQGGQP